MKNKTASGFHSRRGMRTHVPTLYRGHASAANEVRLSLRFRDTILPAKMEREAAIRLLRALIAAGLRQRESMANAAIRSVADQA